MLKQNIFQVHFWFNDLKNGRRSRRCDSHSDEWVYRHLDSDRHEDAEAGFKILMPVKSKKKNPFVEHWCGKQDVHFTD